MKEGSTAIKPTSKVVLTLPTRIGTAPEDIALICSRVTELVRPSATTLRLSVYSNSTWAFDTLRVLERQLFNVTTLVITDTTHERFLPGETIWFSLLSQPWRVDGTPRWLFPRATKLGLRTRTGDDWSALETVIELIKLRWLDPVEAGLEQPDGLYKLSFPGRGSPDARAVLRELIPGLVIERAVWA